VLGYNYLCLLLATLKKSFWRKYQMEMIELLKQSVELGASDLHLSAGMPPILRIDGDLAPIPNTPMIDSATTKALIYSVINNEQQKKFENELDLDSSVFVSDLAHFRINVFNQMNGIAAVFRTIPETVPTLDQMQYPDVFKKLLDLPNGLILITGPTGSGKSTTLAAMIDYINTTRASHIITVEDPIEFTHQSKKSLINQRQVSRDTRSFDAALRSSLREDPDVILVGEMRDLETIRLALTAAETGHLVMATLHTSSAPHAVNRVVDVFPAGEKNIIRNILSESLQAVVCQTLLKKKTKGRVAAFEIMLGTTAIRNLIREDKVAQMYSAIQTGSEKGMCTLDQYLQKLVANGEIEKSIAAEVAVNKETFN
jgi:twitching motility protein PilT